MMKYRSYWMGKADERLAWEEEHYRVISPCIENFPRGFITFCCCVLALIVPSKRIRVKE